MTVNLIKTIHTNKQVQKMHPREVEILKATKDIS